MAMILAIDYIRSRRRISAQNDPTEAAAAVFDTADEKLAELESETTDFEAEIKQLTRDLQNATSELDAAQATKAQRLAELEDEIAYLEDEANGLTEELQSSTTGLNETQTAKTQQQNVVDAAYEAWAQAVETIPDGGNFTNIQPVSDYSLANYNR